MVDYPRLHKQIRMLEELEIYVMRTFDMKGCSGGPGGMLGEKLNLFGPLGEKLYGGGLLYSHGRIYRNKFSEKIPGSFFCISPPLALGKNLTKIDDGFSKKENDCFVGYSVPCCPFIYGYKMETLNPLSCQVLA